MLRPRSDPDQFHGSVLPGQEAQAGPAADAIARIACERLASESGSVLVVAGDPQADPGQHVVRAQAARPGERPLACLAFSSTFPVSPEKPPIPAAGTAPARRCRSRRRCADDLTPIKPNLTPLGESPNNTTRSLRYPRNPQRSAAELSRTGSRRRLTAPLARPPPGSALRAPARHGRAATARNTLRSATLVCQTSYWPARGHRV